MSADPLEAFAVRYSNWGRWGDGDQLGTVNLITPRRVAAAADLVRIGEVISLCLPFDQSGPQTGANGRFNCLRYSTSTGTDHAAGRQTWNGQALPHGVGFADDAVVLHMHSGTHWDALAHVFHLGRGYNGVPADTVSAEGAARLGIESLSDKLVGRGVLLDLARAHGRAALADGYAVTAADLEAAADSQGVEVREGDILLLRTGQLGSRRRDGWGSFAGGPAPGLSFYTLPWLSERGVAAVATDTWGVEVRPNELADSYQPFHVVALVYIGLLLGEMFALDALAQACERIGRYEMLVIAPPVPFTGAAGAPPAPVAIL